MMSVMVCIQDMMSCLGDVLDRTMNRIVAVR